MLHQENDNSLTFMNLADIASTSLRYMSLINKAGNLVEPTQASISSAMNDFQSIFQQGNFTIDIYDGDGNNTWPLSYMTYLSLSRNITKFDCTTVYELLSFVAWVHTNDAYDDPSFCCVSIL